MGYSPQQASNESGLGLLEVVASSGIMSVLLFSLASSVTNAQQAGQFVQRRLAFIELQSFLNQALTNAQTCSPSLAGNPAPVVGNSLPTLNFAGTLIDDSAHNLFGQIRITSLKYTSVTNLGSVYNAVATAEVDLSGGSGVTPVGGNPKPVNFPVTLTVTAGNITQCGASANVQVAKITTSCTPIAGTSFSSCTDTLAWPSPFADMNYSVTCNGVAPTNTTLYMNVDTYDAATVTARTVTGATSTGNFSGGVTCIGVHS